MTQKQERVLWIVAVVLVVLWFLRKKGGLGFGFGLNAGPLAAGLGASVGPAPTTGSTTGSGPTMGGGCCCGQKPTGPNAFRGLPTGDYSQGGNVVSVPVSWINADVSQSPGWVDIPFGG